MSSTKFKIIGCWALMGSLLFLNACNSTLTVSQPSESTGAGGNTGASTGPGGGNDSQGNNGSDNTQTFSLKAQADYYRQRYGLKDPYAKLVSNTGAGYDNLYGVRNLRLVLHGIYYRGGANNLYNKYGKRSNENPLPDIGLTNLCNEGFSDALYFYPTNFKTAPPTTNCVNLDRENSVLNYNQLSVLSSGNEKKLLQRVYDHIKGVRKGPMYGHCWNGWHASGYGAAITLRQFCDWKADAAVDYWIKNTDGDSNYSSIKNKIKSFTAFDEFKISAEEKAAICP